MGVKPSVFTSHAESAQEISAFWFVHVKFCAAAGVATAATNITAAMQVRIIDVPPTDSPAKDAPLYPEQQVRGFDGCLGVRRMFAPF
jgi:hypothetical protein